MSMIQEFKTFIRRGNVLDLAVGVVIGGAFGKVVSSFVADVFTPPLGLLIGGVHFADLKLTLKAAAGETPAVSLNYGAFLQASVDFLIIAFAVFLVVKAANRMKQKEEAAPPPVAPEPSEEAKLLTEIRDLLRREA